MRVALTAPSYAPNVTGPGEAVGRIAEGLRERGHAVQVYTYGADPASVTPVIPLRRLRAEPFGSHRALAAALDRFRPDLVWAHELRNSLTTTACAWARRRGARFVLQPHGGLTVLPRLPFRARAAYRALDWLSRMPPRAGQVVATCQAEREALIRAGTDPGRIVVLYLGSDGRPAARKPRPEPHVLMLANLGYIRDPRLAIRAVRQATEAGCRARLTLAGPIRTQSRLVRPAKRHDLDGATYVGPVAPDRRAAALADADVFLYPTRYESFGLPLLEAAVAGLPVVAPPEGIVPELGLDEVGGVAPLDRLGHALVHVLQRLPQAREAAVRRAGFLQPWAAWPRRIRRVADWVEDPESAARPDAPPVLGHEGSSTRPGDRHGT